MPESAAGARVEVTVAPVTESTEREWDALACATGAPPFVRPGWLRAWSRAFTAGALPELLTARRGGGLVGVAPVIRRRGGVWSATNSTTPLYDVVVTDDDVACALVGAALDRAARRVDLGHLSARGPAARAFLTETEARRLPVLSRPMERSPFVTVGGDTSWEDYQRRLGADRRSWVRRRTRQLAELGRVDFEVSDGRDDLDRLLDEGFAIEGSGWKDRHGTSIASSPVVRDFYTDAARWAAAVGVLRLLFLRVDGRAVAFQYMIEQPPVLYDLKRGYDPAYSRCSPGALLTLRTVEYAFARPDLTTLDLLGEAEAHKLRWADSADQRVRVAAFTRPGTGRWERRAVELGSDAKDVLRERVSTGVWDRLSAARGRLVGMAR